MYFQYFQQIVEISCSIELHTVNINTKIHTKTDYTYNITVIYLYII